MENYNKKEIVATDDRFAEMLEEARDSLQLAIESGATKEQLIANAEKALSEGKIKQGDYQVVLYGLGIKTDLNKQWFEWYN